MKVAILNYTGNVGKTTIAAHLLSPRMQDAEIFAIESINSTASDAGLDVTEIRGKHFADLYKKIMQTDDAIIDVGASNIEDFLDRMEAIDESHLEFDYFIVPCTPGQKEMREAINIMSTLSNDFNVPAEKILPVLNRAEADPAVLQRDFDPIIKFAKTGKCTFSPDAVIYETELFDLLSAKKLTVSAILSDETDYRAKAKDKSLLEKERNAAANMHLLKAMAKAVNRNLDDVFNALFCDK